MKNTGTLRIQAFAARQSSPVEGVTVTVSGDGFTATRLTDAEGNADDVTLTTPACALSLDENNTTQPPYAVCDLVASKTGYRTVRIQGVQVFPGQVTLAQPEMIPDTEEMRDTPNVPIVIPPHSLFTSDGVVGRTTWNKLYEVYNDIANRLLSPSLRPGEYPGVLRNGSTGTAVRELQFYLYLMSAYQSSIPSVSIDGRFGAATEAAVRAYQRFAGLTVDGIVGRKTWDSLYGKASALRSSGPVVTLKRLPYPGTPLTVGTDSSAVLYYTLLLQRIAYYYDSVASPALSSQYTQETADATASAQELLGLPATGVADAETWTAVEALSLQLAAFTPNPDRHPEQGPDYPDRAMKEGSAGPDVSLIEGWLNDRSQLYCEEDYVPDNAVFGPEDTAAVKDTQRRASLEPNGVVDRPTWAALRAQSHTACDNCTEEG